MSGLAALASQLDHSHAYSTREFFLLGRELSEIATEDGILTSAFKSRVPIICLPLPTAHSVLQ